MSATVSERTVASGLLAVRHVVRRRRLIVLAALVVVLIAVLLLGLVLGDYPMSLGQIWQTIWGSGTKRDAYVLFQVRMPRVAMGIVAGACLAIAGALLQALLRNSLASPDLLGISGGSTLGALVVLLVFGISGPVLALAAFVGGLAVAVILLAAGGRRGEAGFRLILAGIGVSFLCVAVTNFLLVHAKVELAQAAIIWITGTLGSTPWWQVAVVAGTLVAVTPGVWFAARWLPITQLGSSTAVGLGANRAAIRVWAVGGAVLLTAVVCAFTGPIAFVALCAPAIARSLLGHGAIAVGASALTGAMLLAAADLVAQFAIPGLTLPVGIVTGALGAVFLLWLLASTKGRQL